MAIASTLGSAFPSVAVPARTVFAQPVLSTPAVLLPAEWVAGPESVPGRPGRQPQRQGDRPHATAAAAPIQALPLLLTAALLISAALLAPERPGDQEAICQRHNGVAACRVW